MRRVDAVVPNLHLGCVVDAPPIEAGCHQHRADQGMRRREILDVKEIDALSEDLRLVVLLDAEPLARIAPSEARLKQVWDGIVRHGALR